MAPLSLSDIAALTGRAIEYAEGVITTESGVPHIECLTDEDALEVMSWLRDRISGAWAIGYAAALDDESRRGWGRRTR